MAGTQHRRPACASAGVSNRSIDREEAHLVCVDDHGLIHRLDHLLLPVGGCEVVADHLGGHDHRAAVGRLPAPPLVFCEALAGLHFVRGGLRRVVHLAQKLAGLRAGLRLVGDLRPPRCPRLDDRSAWQRDPDVIGVVDVPADPVVQRHAVPHVELEQRDSVVFPIKHNLTVAVHHKQRRVADGVVQILLLCPLDDLHVGDEILPERRLQGHECGVDGPLTKENLRKVEVAGPAPESLPCPIYRCWCVTGLGRQRQRRGQQQRRTRLQSRPPAAGDG
mmetsp:Transcript_29825/g.77099  ORF Transcript_29825/g.77099 Transcript_29825/m.77099 type:complete len:277 (-) Transcript_29825:395-1225(-)